MTKFKLDSELEKSIFDLNTIDLRDKLTLILLNRGNNMLQISKLLSVGRESTRLRILKMRTNEELRTLLEDAIYRSYDPYEINMQELESIGGYYEQILSRRD